MFHFIYNRFVQRFLLNYLTIFFIFSILGFSPCFAQEDDKIAGEFFGVPVPMNNYKFAKGVVVRLNAKWRGTPQNEEELEDLVWQELLFSYEAFNRDIEATREEIEEEIDKILKSDKVQFNRKEDKEAYQNWVEEKLKESVVAFEQQIEHLIKLEKLRQQVLDSIEPGVTEKEAYQKFLDEHNTLSVELLQFEDLQAAQKFYKQVTAKPARWERRRKKEPNDFKRPGFVALDFLIHMWGFRREDAYRMMDMNAEEFYHPAPIYKGYAVFKILEIRKANTEEFAKRKDYYFEKIRTIKKHEGFKDWVKELREKANIKVFIEK